MIARTAVSMVLSSVAVLACAGAALAGDSAATPPGGPMSIQEKVTGPKRHITTDDLVRIRDIDSLSVSPDGQRFAILVRQAVPEKNQYRTGFFTGSLRGGSLTWVGDGGEERVLRFPNGTTAGDFGGSVSRWSPDGRFIAYMVKRNGEVQLWKSRSDGGEPQQQLTRNASDVRDFAWSADGQSLFFKAGTPRTELAARAEAKSWSGWRLQEFDSMFRALGQGAPAVPLETELKAWRVGADGSGERLADAAEQSAFAAAQKRQAAFMTGGVEIDAMQLSVAMRPPIERGDGAVAWVEKTDPTQDGPLPYASPRVRMKEGAEPIVCSHNLCDGQMFNDLWWSEDGSEVLFQRWDGDTDKSQSIYAWSPRRGTVRTLTSSPQQRLDKCGLVGKQVVCLRETPLEPRHVAAIDVKTGAIRKVGDVNPEMALFHLGRLEYIEWDTGPKAKEFGYAPRALGFILYPPDYDPKKKYPVFVGPYDAGGFIRGDVGNEQPMLVYSANGFIVIDSAFPGLIRNLTHNDNVKLMRRLYDPKEGYPHLTMFADSAFRSLDVALGRASIDEKRVGSGGVSHGTFIPLLMMQKTERIAALALAGGSWNQLEYYFAKLPEPWAERELTMFPEDPEFWRPLDMALNLEQVEAPILFNIADSEMIGSGVLLRRMNDARLPYDAYVFHGELHLKWQSAHRLAVYDRNLDWFRFWLQDVEDADPKKAEQYERWRKLRTLQCENKRSLRDYCNVTSTVAAAAR
jgi:hypothetical protein